MNQLKGITKESLTYRIFEYISRAKTGRTSRQIIKFADGIGDPTRLCRFLQNAGLVDSEWIRKKIKGKIKRFKLYWTVA